MRWLILAAAAVAAFVLGFYFHARWWAQLRQPTPHIQLDAHGRLAGYPGKTVVPCPARPDYVLLMLGQSNAANSGGQRYVGREGVVNYYAGKCYAAASPLLGSSGVSGEAWSLLGNTLEGTVVLMPAAVGSTTVKQWALGELLPPAPPWPVTHVLWHQGEDDYAKGTTDYAESFSIFLARLRRLTDAPVFVSMATRCGDGAWHFRWGRHRHPHG